jgi:hypothetical protein
MDGLKSLKRPDHGAPTDEAGLAMSLTPGPSSGRSMNGFRWGFILLVTGTHIPKIGRAPR